MARSVTCLTARGFMSAARRHDRGGDGHFFHSGGLEISRRSTSPQKSSRASLSFLQSPGHELAIKAIAKWRSCAEGRPRPRRVDGANGRAVALTHRGGVVFPRTSPVFSCLTAWSLASSILRDTAQSASVSDSLRYLISLATFSREK